MASDQAVTKIPASKITSTFAGTVNLASAALNARVLACSDDYFASATNLINPAPPIHRPGVFVHTGAWYDGWETRRHNPAEYDWVVIKLGVLSGVVEGVEIDTAYFTGNYGEKVLVEGTCLSGSLSASSSDHNNGDDAKVVDPAFSGWHTILPLQPCGPSQRQAWKLPRPTTPLTHVRVRMYPDGGFARLRLYGHVVPPELPTTTTANGTSNGVSNGTTAIIEEELSSALMGGIVLSASDEHYTPASNILLPGRGKDMGDGWETARSRAPGHVDWAVIKLGLPAASVTKVVVDTKDFRGNFPRDVRVHGLYRDPDDKSSPAHDDPGWTELVRGDQPCKADTEHSFAGDHLASDPGRVITHVKLTLVPDGGVKRFRVFGQRKI